MREGERNIKAEMDLALAFKAQFDEFKIQLLSEIKTLISQSSAISQKKYLKSKEVMSILEISAGTLQTRRNSGEIPFTKIGGCLYYDRDEIQKVLENNKVERKSWKRR